MYCWLIQRNQTWSRPHGPLNWHPFDDCLLMISFLTLIQKTQCEFAHLDAKHCIYSVYRCNFYFRIVFRTCCVYDFQLTRSYRCNLPWLKTGKVKAGTGTSVLAKRCKTTHNENMEVQWKQHKVWFGFKNAALRFLSKYFYTKWLLVSSFFFEQFCNKIHFNKDTDIVR